MCSNPEIQAWTEGADSSLTLTLPGTRMSKKFYGKYEAFIIVNGYEIFIGRYSSEKEAHHAFILVLQRFSRGKK
jgi:hypothetical protein